MYCAPCVADFGGFAAGFEGQLISRSVARSPQWLGDESPTLERVPPTALVNRHQLPEGLSALRSTAVVPDAGVVMENLLAADGLEASALGRTLAALDELKDALPDA